MPNSHEKLNLDRLLDLKRAEKPSDEFWSGFQREFRQRQLQSLIEKESVWSRLPRIFIAHSGVVVPFSAVALALFILVVNFREDSPIHNEYFEAASMIQATPQVELTKDTVEETPSKSVIENAEFAVASSSAPSFVMDLIPNDEPDSLSYTREFPTSTLPAENRAVSALVSYTIARDFPTFGLAASQQTIGY